MRDCPVIQSAVTAIKNTLDNRCQDDLHDIQLDWIPEANHDEAFVRCRNVAGDKRVGSIDGRYALEIDVGT